MLYPYVTLGDGTAVLHTQIIEEDGIEKVEIQFEKPIEEGFKSARCTLPDYKWSRVENCSEEDISLFTKIVESNADLFFEYARTGGIESCRVS